MKKIVLYQCIHCGHITNNNIICPLCGKNDKGEKGISENEFWNLVEKLATHENRR